MTILGCIADDFTGATDLASLLARSGIKVSLRIGIPSEEPDVGKTAPVEIIALKCRSVETEQANKETTEALAWLKKSGAKRFFWKYCSTFDSTEQGNIGTVAEALMKEIGTDQTMYCPAFPENGRTVFMGHLFVGEQLLSDSPMKDHPLTPMKNSNLETLLKPQVKGKTGLVKQAYVSQGVDAVKTRFAELKNEGVAHIVVDAVANDDLFTIAKACAHMPLMTGGSAIAMPLPHVYKEQGLLSDNALSNENIKVSGGNIVLSGSCSAMTRKQVSEFSKTAVAYQLNPLDIKENGIQGAKDWLSGQDINADKMIYATAEPETVEKIQKELGIEEAGLLVENALAELASYALELGVRRFVVAGGETSGAVTKALNVTQLTIGKEIATGVPWTYCQSGSEQIALALKSGNFGDEQFFSKAFKLLGE